MNGVNEGDLAAQLLGGVGNVAGHVALIEVGADEFLLQQAALLVESGHLAGGDLLLHSGGLGSHLGVVVHQSDLHGQLLVHVGLRHLRLVPVLGAHSSDLHGDVLADLGGVNAALHGQIHQNAVGAARVNVGNGGVVGKTGEAADLHVLADGHDLLLHDLGDGQVGARIFAGLESVHISGVLGGDDGSQILYQIHKSVGLGGKVGLGVDLDDDADAVYDGSIGNALGGDAVGLLGGLGKALLTQPVHGGVHITVGGLKSLLAVHHADVGHFTELLNVQCGKSHFRILLSAYYSAAVSAGASAGASAASSP